MFNIWLRLLSCILCCAISTSSVQPKTTWHKKPTVALPESHLHVPQKPIIIERAIQPQLPEKEWNIIIYVAGNNNLYSFVDAHLRQLMAIGSTDLINIIVQVDKFGTHDVTRSLVQKNKMDVYWKASDFSATERIAHPEIYNSGALTNFINFVQTAIQQFPARKQAIIIWNHGSGSYDPVYWRHALPDQPTPLTRGMAFNDNYNYYLSNQDLTSGLRTITHNVLNGKRINILGLDICHGGQLEIASQVKDYVEYMVGSEEVGINYGWNYTRALNRLSKELRTPQQFASDCVEAYRDDYINVIPDYTLAVYNLFSQDPLTGVSYFQQLEGAINALSEHLIALLRSSQKNIFRSIVSDARYKKNLCCDFYSGEYIDLHLFLLTLQGALRQALNVHNLRAQNPDTATHTQEAITAATKAIELIYKVVPVYTSGVAFSGNPIRARGMLIGFPPRVIHSSYTKTIFAQTNSWFKFLKEFLVTRDKEKEHAYTA